jgi:biofilm PGA synthesis N-glycosyltransferase PgaC
MVADWILAFSAAVATASLIWMWYGPWSRGVAARRRPIPSSGLPERWPSVSVIIPAWQERPTIGRCLASLRTVDYPTWEIVLVAGGSDDTYGVAMREAESLPNCQVIEQQPLGKPAALNVGLRAAKGEVIVLLDADSRVSPEWLRALVAPLGRVVRATTGNPSPSRLTPIARVEQMERIAVYDVRGTVILQGSGSIAMTRDLIDEIGTFPEDVYSQDWDLDARLAAAGVVRGYCRGATLRTERPATLREFWKNEVRWRRAHLVSLFHLRRYFFRSVRSALGGLYPYIAGWVAALLTAFSIAVLSTGDPDLRRRVLALWGITIGWLLLQRVGLVLQVVAYTGDRRWLRDVWAPPFLFLVTLVASCLASLTTHRATLHFKGPRPIAEDDPAP